MSLNRNHCVCNRNVYLYGQLCKELKRLLLILFKEIFVLFVLLLFWITEDAISFFFFIQSVFKNLKKKSRSQDGVARKHIYRSVSMYLLFCIMKKFHRKSHPPWAHFSFMILIWKKSYLRRYFWAVSKEMIAHWISFKDKRDVFFSKQFSVCVW